MPDGAARQVADNVMFPNGMVITPDNTTLVVAAAFRIDGSGQKWMAMGSKTGKIETVRVAVPHAGRP